MPRRGTGSKQTPPATPAPADGGQPNGQPVQAPTGLPYGEREDAETAQSQVPLPAEEPPPSGPVGRSPEAILGAAGAMPFSPVDTYGPSRRPREAVTEGLPSGPGAGPEVMPGTDRLAGMFDTLADTTGDPRFRELAHRARMQRR